MARTLSDLEAGTVERLVKGGELAALERGVCSSPWVRYAALAVYVMAYALLLVGAALDKTVLKAVLLFHAAIPFAVAGIHLHACSRSRPFELEDDDALGAASNEDPYGAQLQLMQVSGLRELCGTEAMNKYSSADGCLFVSERSDGLQRAVAPWNHERTLFGHAGPSEDSPAVLRMHKPYHCQGCLCWRPRLAVDLPDGSKVGSVESPAGCCSVQQSVLNAEGELRFSVTGSACQCGICCPLFADAEFQVRDAGGEEVGEIVRMKRECLEVCGARNRLVVNFPMFSTMDDKRLLLAAAMLMDIHHFS